MVIGSQGAYQYISRIYDILDAPSEILYHRYMRQKWLSSLRNETIIELGVGTGKNFPFYHKSNRVVGIENNPYMLLEAKKRIAKIGRQKQITLSWQRQIPWKFEQKEFTVGIASFVFCTMSNPSPIIDEFINRIMPGGKIILFEYMRPRANPTYSIVHTLNPYFKILYGVDFNRRPTRKYIKNKVSSMHITTIIPYLLEVVEIVK